MMLVLLYAIYLGIGVRSTWEDDTDFREQLTSYNMLVSSSDTEEDISFLLPEQVNSFEKLCKKADIVARVKMNSKSNRTSYTQCVLSEVEILEVYQGQVSSENIFVFEPSYVKEDTIYTVGSYLPMEDGKEYIMFLRKIDCGLYQGQDAIYLPTTTGLSKYQCEERKMTGNVYPLKEDRTADYKKCYNFDAVIMDKQLKDMYRAYKMNIQTLTRSRKSSTSIAQSNKWQVGTCLYQEGDKPFLIGCDSSESCYEQVSERIANIRLTFGG